MREFILKYLRQQKDTWERELEETEEEERYKVLERNIERLSELIDWYESQ